MTNTTTPAGTTTHNRTFTDETAATRAWSAVNHFYTGRPVVSNTLDYNDDGTFNVVTTVRADAPDPARLARPAVNVFDGGRFDVGQRVAIGPGPVDAPQFATRPASILGAIGTVTKRNGVNVWIRFDVNAPARVAGQLVMVRACNVVAL